LQIASNAKRSSVRFVWFLHALFLSAIVPVISSVLSSTHCCIVKGTDAPGIVTDIDHRPDLRRGSSSAAAASTTSVATINSARRTIANPLELKPI
jgi:hypothetical protein